MKKTLKKKLVLAKETVRNLADRDASRAAGATLAGGCYSNEFMPVESDCACDTWGDDVCD